MMSAALVSCKKDGDINVGSAKITFHLTDAPAIYDEVNIDIIGARIIVNDSIIDLDVKEGIYNLLDFANGKDTVIIEQQIPAGKLSQIRLILGDNNSVLIGSESYSLTTPSAQQSGLKLNVHEEFSEGIAYEYTLDFDAGRSIVKTGNGKFILKPVIRVVSESVSGAIAGVVKPAAARPLIYAISSQLDSVSAFADTISGKFMFKGLPAGVYKLDFKPQTPYKDTTLLNISVKNAVVTKIDTLKLK